MYPPFLFYNQPVPGLFCSYIHMYILIESLLMIYIITIWKSNNYKRILTDMT